MNSVPIPVRPVVLRYFLAILATASLMVWQATDSATGEFINRAVFWFVAVVAGWLQMALIARGVRSAFGSENYPGWTLLLLSAGIGAIPLTFEVRWLMAEVVQPEQGLPPPWVTLLNVCFINLNFSLIQYILVERWPLGRLLTTSQASSDRSDRSKSHTETSELSSQQSTMVPNINLLRHPPDGLEGQILYMQMEDHYLCVHTTEGKGLMLCRMTDAVADLADTNGLRVHRSWWVSREAVQTVKRVDRKLQVITTNGTCIPVGRSYESLLRESGWF